MKERTDIKRQIPILVSILIAAVFLIGLATVFILNATEFQLILASPLGLALFFAHLFWTAKDFPMAALTPLVIVSYGLYVALFVAMFVARKWRTLAIVSFILSCVILLSLAGYHQITNGIH